MSPSIKDLLQRVANHEHRTLSNMLEVLIIERAERLGVAGATRSSTPTNLR